MKMKLVKITEVHPSSPWADSTFSIIGSNAIIWDEEIVGNIHYAQVYFVTGPFINLPHNCLVGNFEYEELL